VTGVPEVDYGGQGGLGDVIPHPEFSTNHIVYLSYAEAGDDSTRGAAVARAELNLQAAGGGRLVNLTVIWRQTPKVSGRGHFGHRLAFDPQGYLFVSSGERQKFSPAQDMQQNLGKIIRLHDDGAIPRDNPFAARGGVAAEVWSLGQRNPLGIAFAANGELWEIEMGPAGGDELNLITRGTNYGYPTVSNGNHYSGADIPDHHTHPEFAPPVVWWTPVISPADLMIYEADLFPGWRGNAFVAGLSSQSLVRIEFTGAGAREAERFAMGERIRAVRQGPEGAIYLLEDGSDGRLLRLTPQS
jgi:glucose/arabinose dehydrogenase